MKIQLGEKEYDLAAAMPLTLGDLRRLKKEHGVELKDFAAMDAMMDLAQANGQLEIKSGTNGTNQPMGPATSILIRAVSCHLTDNRPPFLRPIY